MTRLCILHGGMPKTGSTSIQAAFGDFSSSKLVYAPLLDRNHTHALRAMFGPDGSKRAKNLPSHMLSKSFYAKSGNLLDQFDAFLRSESRDVLISSERLSTPGTAISIERMFDFLNQYFDKYLFVAYVRAPDTFVTSYLQEKMKGYVCEFDPKQAYPNYRTCFQPWLDRLGSENVRLVEFNRSTLRDGDIVQDFASVLGVDAPKLADAQRNIREFAESVAIQQIWNRKSEATPLSFAQRAKISYGRRRVQGYGQQSFQISEDILRAICDTNRDDIAWIEEKLCTSFRTAKNPKKQINFSDEASFSEYAQKAEIAFWEFVRKNWRWRTDTKLALEAIGRTLTRPE